MIMIVIIIIIIIKICHVTGDFLCYFCPHYSLTIHPTPEKGKFKKEIFDITCDKKSYHFSVLYHAFQLTKST